MKILRMVIVVGVLACAMPAWAGDGKADARFRACEQDDHLVWVDTSTGQVWWANPATGAWSYVGKPEGAVSGAWGTYLPKEGDDDKGLFILNVVTGEGWWTDGKVWKALGMPTEGEAGEKEP